MDDQFDKKLSSRITEVFDNYEYPPAEDGWARLRKKFPAKGELKTAWLWWGSAAAILLVFLGLGIWLINKPNRVNNLAVLPKKIRSGTGVTSGSRSIKYIKPETANARQPQSDSTLVTNKHNTAFARQANRILPDNYVAGGKPVKPLVDYSNAAAGRDMIDRPVNTDGVITGSVKNAGTVKNGTDDQINAAKIEIKATQPDSAQKAGDNQAGRQEVKAVLPVVVNTVAGTQPAKTIDELFKQEKPQFKKQEKDAKELKRINFSVFAATYFNYAEGSASRVNAGAGFSSDIRLSKNIKLSTGLAVAQNTLSYSGTPPLEAAGRALAKAAPAKMTAGFFSTATAVAEFQNYNASLVGLDIPLNIKFEFNPKKTDAYISAGFSSGTFIDERYTYSYAYKTNGFTNKTVSTQDQTTTSSFNNFYFAKTLNLSFGVGYPVGKNRLVIEPFVKYPLAGLGTQDIRFGAGGVNLKFSFKTAKR